MMSEERVESGRAGDAGPVAEPQAAGQQAQGQQIAVGAPQPRGPHRFRKGQSGNPAGRPRRQRATGGPGDRLPGADEPTRAMILTEAYRMMRVEEDGRTIELPAHQAVMRAMIRNAVAGSRIAQWRFTQIVQEAERQTKQEQVTLYNAFEWQGMLREPKPTRESEIIVDPRSSLSVVVRPGGTGRGTEDE
jgi:hypothetical protein